VKLVMPILLFLFRKIEKRLDSTVEGKHNRFLYNGSNSVLPDHFTRQSRLLLAGALIVSHYDIQK
jgi:hypothetical protein